MRYLALAVVLAACTPQDSTASRGGSAGVTLSGAVGSNAKTTTLTGGLDIAVLGPSSDAGTGSTVIVIRTIGDAYFFHPYLEVDLPGQLAQGTVYSVGNGAKVVLAEDMDKIPPRDFAATSGTVTVDSVTATGLGLRFDVQMGPDASMPGNGATGTFHLTGTILAATP